MNDSDIEQLALASAAARIDWPGRGRSPTGYVAGMAVSYARAVALGFSDPSIKAMCKPLGSDGRDALTHYNLSPPTYVDRLRMTWALLWGLGMRESSGRYCEGRDRSASNVTSDTAEAGLFQMSWDIHESSQDIDALFRSWSGDSLLEIFRQGVVPHSGDLQNYGSGDGAKFQEMCKSNPQFAADCAAIGLRAVRTHWGPINRREAQVRQEVIDLLIQIEIAAPLSNHRENDMSGWRLAKSLEILRDQINAAYPNRSKTDDGTIGDTRHQATRSDHNPNAAGVVCAMDVTHDPAHGFDSYKFADYLRTHPDKRARYIISNSRIAGDEGYVANNGGKLWTWARYTGTNPHDHHVHISVDQNAASYDLTGPWDIGPLIPADPKAPAKDDLPVLAVGSTGAMVEKIQALLHLTIDSQFGPATQAAVKEFQTAHGLVADGIVGGYTWRALQTLPNTGIST